MKIAKEFKWEMGHRLRFHKGKCVNIHGHSYKMRVEFEGEPDNAGMVLDYFDMKKNISPIVEELDHKMIVHKDDTELIESLKKLKSEYLVVDFETTAENFCSYFLNKIGNSGLPENIKSVKVRIFETENTYAEDQIEL